MRFVWKGTDTRSINIFVKKEVHCSKKSLRFCRKKSCFVTSKKWKGGDSILEYGHYTMLRIYRTVITMMEKFKNSTSFHRKIWRKHGVHFMLLQDEWWRVKKGRHFILFLKCQQWQFHENDIFEYSACVGLYGTSRVAYLELVGRRESILINEWS